jgi:hypothetical protein
LLLGAPILTGPPGVGKTTAAGGLTRCAERSVHGCEGRPDLFEPGVLAAISSEFDDLGEFEGHAIDVAGMDAEEAATVVSARLADGSLAL